MVQFSNQARYSNKVRIDMDETAGYHTYVDSIEISGTSGKLFISVMIQVICIATLYVFF